jgi:hypothetical protein
MDVRIHIAGGHRRRAIRLLGVVAAVAVAGCQGDTGTLVVLNRTSVPIVLEQFGYTDSTLVVGACSERTIIWNRVWGGDGPSGNWPYETVPPDAFAMPLPGDWLFIPMEQGSVEATLLVTPDGIGVSQEKPPRTPVEVTTGGSFPPDPGSETCAGVPPPMPSGSPAASPP